MPVCDCSAFIKDKSGDIFMCMFVFVCSAFIKDKSGDIFMCMFVIVLHLLRTNQAIFSCACFI